MTDGKTFLITGATAGIGRHAALHLAKAGHRVFATGRREPALRDLQDEAGDLDLVTFRLDVNDPRSIAAAVELIDDKTDERGIDVLVNNAGYGLVAPLALVSDGDLRAQFDTNVFGLMAVTRAFLPKMMVRRSGRIINVSSVGGQQAFPLMAAYNASKFAVESLSDGLRWELAPFGIKVSIIEPGPIKTEFGDVAMGTFNRYSRGP